MNEIHALDKKRAEVERELFQLRPLKSKLDDMETEVVEIIKKKGKSDTEINRLTILNRDLENDLIAK